MIIEVKSSDYTIQQTFLCLSSQRASKQFSFILLFVSKLFPRDSSFFFFFACVIRPCLHRSPIKSIPKFLFWYFKCRCDVGWKVGVEKRMQSALEQAGGLKTSPSYLVLLSFDDSAFYFNQKNQQQQQQQTLSVSTSKLARVCMKSYTFFKRWKRRNCSRYVIEILPNFFLRLWVKKQINIQSHIKSRFGGKSQKPRQYLLHFFSASLSASYRFDSIAFN